MRRLMWQVDAAFRCVLIAAVLLSSFGVSLVPVRQTPRAAATDEWFPCKDHGCGCTSAAVCRTNCCCAIKPAPAEPEAIRRIVVLQPTPPRSCCSHGAAEQPAAINDVVVDTMGDGSGTWSIQAVFRSVECSGRPPVTGLSAAMMVFAVELPVIDRPALLGTVSALVLNCPEGVPLPPGSPPPRRV